MKTIILINQAANHSNAARKWALIRADFLQRLSASSHVIEYTPPFEIGVALTGLLEAEEACRLIIAGGDGSVNYAVNEIMRNEKLRTRVTLGAVGLGSSNDFHKPFKKKIEGVPVRIDAEKSFRTDVGKVRLTRLNGERSERYFVISAGAGIIANGNALFNEGDFLIRLLKTKNVNLAVNYTALKSILLHKNIPVTIQTEADNSGKINLSNLSLLKTPFLSGNLKYDQELRHDDGFFGLNICEEMNLPEILGVFKDLQNGKFSGKPKRYISKVKQLTIHSETEIPIETDGEIYFAVKAEFTVLPSTISLCAS